MKKSKPNQKSSVKKYILLTLLVVILFGIYTYKTTTRFHENDSEIPGTLPSQDIKFLEKCNLYNNFFDAKSESFELVDYKCSEEQEFKNKIPDGQDLTVDIFTKDFEQGKQLFRNWLKEHDLEESNKLRITYIHKPQ